MKRKTLLTVLLILLSYVIQAQSVCDDVDRDLHLQIISKTFHNLPADSVIEKLEKSYFPLTSLLSCLFFLQADLTDKAETKLIYQRITDIALGYIEKDTLIVLTYNFDCGKVTEIFNRFAQKYKVRYINIGAIGYKENVWETIGYFNQQMECRLIEVNGKDWKKNFHADVEAYYYEQLDKMSRKERRKIKKNNY